MRKFLLLPSPITLAGAFAFIAATANLRAEAGAPAAQPPVNHYAAIDFLVDGTWIGALPPEKDGAPTRLETRFRRPDNRQGVQFDSTWLIGDQRSPYVSGFYAWDGAKGKLAIFYVDASGALVAGTVTEERGVLVHELTVVDPDGKIEPVRTRVTKLNPDTYTNEISVMKDGAWTKLVEVRYERKR